MSVTSVQLPTRTPDQIILLRRVREIFINLINQTVSQYYKGDITSLSLDQKVDIALSNFLIPYMFLVDTKVVITRLPDEIDRYMRMEDLARLMPATFVSGINVIYLDKPVFLQFLEEDYITASNTLKT